MTPGEFAEFQAWQNLKMQRREKWEYYAAQIAGALLAKPGQAFRINSFLLKFSSEKAKPLKLTGHELAAMFKAGFGIEHD